MLTRVSAVATPTAVHAARFSAHLADVRHLLAARGWPSSGLSTFQAAFPPAKRSVRTLFVVFLPRALVVAMEGSAGEAQAPKVNLRPPFVCCCALVAPLVDAQPHAGGAAVHSAPPVRRGASSSWMGKPALSLSTPPS